MNSENLRQLFEKAISQRNWKARWDGERDVLEIHHNDMDKPFAISLPRVLNRIRERKENPQHVVEDLIRQAAIVAETARIRKQVALDGHDRNIFPVIRSASFPTETGDGKKLIHEPHTAETRIYYALDLGKSYTLIDGEMLDRSGWTEEELKEKALFNLRRLGGEAKRDDVAGNRFYFISPKDGYAASRILNQALLETFREKAEGNLCLAIPHQDVLVIADVCNDTGYDIIQQLALSFYRQGDMPITFLPFEYHHGQLEPIFILARRKVERDSHDA